MRGRLAEPSTGGRGRFVFRVVGAARLIHPFPVMVVVITSGVLLELATRGGVGAVFLLRACATVLCSQVAVGAYNDYVDRHSDMRVQPSKPIPSGEATPQIALVMVISGLVLMVPLALSFGPVSFLLVLAGTSAGLIYDAWLKRTAASFLAYIAGFLLLVTWIWILAGHLSRGFLILYPAGALIVTAAHLAQSLPDVESDRQVGAHGLAVALGVRGSALAIGVCYGLLAMGSLAVCLAAGLPLLSVVPVFGSAAVAMAVRRLWRASTTRAEREFAFRIIAPALAVLAVATAAAYVRLGLL